MKTCTKCKIEKQFSEFYKHSQSKDNLSTACKTCVKSFYNYKYSNDLTYRESKAKRQSERWLHDSQYRADQARRQRIRAKERYHSDPNFKLSRILRIRLNEAVRNNHRSGSAVRDLGCSIADFKIYIENQFKPGMTWDNWTDNGWHLDHKIPFAAFDLTDPVQLKQATHFTNLQPLWAVDNLKKSDSVCL